MLTELGREEFERVRALFEGHSQYVPALAVLEGSFPGRVFVDRIERPTAAIVWALSRWGYAEGDPCGLPPLEDFRAFLRDTVVPCSRELEQDWFELYLPDDPAWTERVGEAFAAFKSDHHRETTFTLDEEAFRKNRRDVPLPDGVRIERADVPILPARARRAPPVAEEFRSVTAFSFRLLAGDRVASSCWNNGFVSGREFMVGVETADEGERGRGYATAVSTALLDHSIENGWRPLWETTEWNEPSLRVARKLGFREDESYPVYGMMF
jgi:GNAT superfamily N-acetyltransferase